MNVLYTSYYGLGIGGAEVSMSLLARKLSGKHNIVIASTENYVGFKTYLFNRHAKKIPNFYIQNAYMANFFSKIVKRENIKIIHSHDSRTAVAAIMAAKMNKIKAVTHYRDYWFCCPKSSLLRTDMVNCEECNPESLKKCYSKPRQLWNRYKLRYLRNIAKTLKSADAKIAISKAVDEKLMMAGIDGAVIINNGVDILMFKSAKNRGNHNLGDTTIGYIGSLNYNKGVKNLVPIAKKALGKYKRVEFLITGDGALKEWIMDELKEYGDRVKFNGNVSYANIAEVYNGLDIVLIPSIWQEPFSRVAIEAMAAGKPIVASDVGGLKNIIKKDFGFLVDANDTSKWTEAIDLLVSKPVKRRLMGINAMKESRKYDINLVAKDVDKIYMGLT